MIKKKQITRTSQVTVLECVICDLCKKETTKEDIHNLNSGNWSKDQNHIDIITVEHVEGYAAYDGGWKATEHYDICPECFNALIVPYFKSLGMTPQLLEFDW